MQNFITQAASQFGAIWKKIGINQRISIVLVAVIVVGSLWAFVSIARRPDYEMLFTNVAPEDGASIASQLRELNIPYKISGSSIYVQSSRRDEVRMNLAEKGLLPKGSNFGWNELFPTGSSFTQTDKELQYKYVRALQGEIARSIESIASINSAKVHIVLPEEKLFEVDRKPSTASIIVEIRPGSILQEERIDSIRYLVSNSIPGLEVRNITIVDTQGNLLTQQDGDTGLSVSDLKYKRQVEKDLALKVQSMLDATLGVGKSIVRVTAEINKDEMTTRETTVRQGTTVSETISSTQNTDTSSKSGGVPGVTTNITAVIPGMSGGTDTSSSQKTETIESVTKPSERETITKINPGSIKKLSVSAMIDKKRENDSSTITDLEEVIKTAVGYNRERGDEVVVKEIEFAAIPFAPSAGTGTMGNPVFGHILRNLPPAAIIIVLLVFFKQLLKKTKLPERALPEEFGRPAHAMGRLAGATTTGNISVGEAEELLDIPAHKTPPMQKLIWKLADEKPEELANVMRSWLKD